MLFYPMGEWIERRFFPVVKDVNVENIEKTEDGVSFYVSFDKVRSCQFIGVAWYYGPVRVGVEFSPDAENYPRTRPVGDQYAGPWMVRAVSTLEGTHAYAIHRCHPFWETISPFFMGDVT